MQNLRDYNDSDLADALIERGVLPAPALERAVQAGKRSNTTLERTLLELGLISEQQLFSAMAEWLDVPLCEPAALDRALVRSFKLDRAFLERVEAVPFFENDAGEMVIATSNPRARDAVQSIAFHLGVRTSPALATRSTIKATLLELFDDGTANVAAGQGGDLDVERLQALANDGPVIGQVNDLIAEAVAARASDIHIEALDAAARVRLRVDGELLCTASSVPPIAQRLSRD